MRMPGGRFTPRKTARREAATMQWRFHGTRCMENPLLGQDALPPFTQIRAEHVEPAVRQLLASSRARLAELSGIANPTFATLIEPLEELHHRVSRTWSPVSH